MSSANGYVLVATKGKQRYELRASWAAPYFVVDSDPFDLMDPPRLIHCDDIDHARRCVQLGGQAFTAHFEPITL